MDWVIQGGWVIQGVGMIFPEAWDVNRRWPGSVLVIDEATAAAEQRWLIMGAGQRPSSLNRHHDRQVRLDHQALRQAVNPG